MIDSSTHRDIARRLDQAEKERVQIRQLHLDHPSLTIEDAYAIQHEWVGMKLAAGRRKVGRKVGLTSKAMQTSVGIDEPDYGTLLDDMVFQDSTDVPIDRFIEPRLEVELAFVLGKKLTGPNITMLDVLSATDYVVPAIEIIDSRQQRVDPQTKGTRTIVDSISDNAANAGIVMGGRPVKPMDVDLRWVAALLYCNGQVEETGVAAGVLNHPCNGVAWLANKLCAFDVSLEPGEIILGGSFTRAIFAHRGDTFHADYGPLGSIAFAFR
ncbi:2-oxo-hepta-3-ene-1,7-dioic acid hydratase [soil metagenome]